ncbi:MAG: UDP-N-acetylmuramate:L-alanyl-gamma-D-glutamyl-meso-diaminopimelate ligase, partial [Gammaproteobacteria bacterium CG_4_9_14_3_um_filter_38_9]
LIINNIEFDHADIFPDIEAIKKQFQYLLRIVPSKGTVIFPSQDQSIQDVLSRGCWAKKITTGEKKSWYAQLLKSDGSEFECYFQGEKRAVLHWQLIGHHNIQNALAAIAAADSIGVSMSDIEKAFATFENVKRRLEIRGCVNNITVYDDFAHHPTAIATTIAGLRARIGDEKMIVIAQLGSNSMRSGAHADTLGPAFHEADEVHVLKPDDNSWDVVSVLKPLRNKVFVHDSVSDIVNIVSKNAMKNSHVLVMSNKGFDGLHDQLLKKLTINR